ncbi:MAG TPA: cell division protein FtsQ/DivIB [Aquabacterium sp.]|nr:cell division protein FtsQ/DivIB [Aquabacterium sp.]
MNAAAALHTTAEMPQDIRWMNAATVALAAIAIGLVVASVLTLLARQPVFAIRQMTLEGDLLRNNLATVRANVLPRVAGSYFQVDLRRARDVFESVPWVRRAVVQRVWPNQLHVTLEEHRPAAYWRHAERDDQLVNVQGEVFDANVGDVEDQPLPVLNAPSNATADQARQMLDMLARLKPVLAPLDAEILALRLNDHGSWSVALDSDATIELGRGEVDEVLERTQRFVRTLPQLQRQYGQPLAYADLRYPKGYAVKLRGLTTFQDISGAPAAGKPRQ